jgi:hypothetical protein
MRESETLRGWEGALERWLAPFLSALGREAQRRWAPVYLALNQQLCYQGPFRVRRGR